MKPTRIQLRRTKGWRMPPNTVKVSRPGPWGNPFVVGRHGTAAECVAAYREWCRHGLAARIKAELRGKNLACWCPLVTSHGEYMPCHADVLLSIANDLPMEDIIRENLRRAKGEAGR